MRLIDTDVLKEWVENWLYKDRYYHNGRVGKTIPITELYDILVQIPTADVPEQRWIPVTERLPEDEQNVLVTVYFHGVRDYSYGENAHLTPSYYVEVAQRYDDEWHSYSDEYKIAKNRHEVIAWMPLPNPWKGEDDATLHSCV